jgi:hypothetical protein
VTARPGTIRSMAPTHRWTVRYTVVPTGSTVELHCQTCGPVLDLGATAELPWLLDEAAHHERTQHPGPVPQAPPPAL